MKLRKELDEISGILDRIVSMICVALTFLMFVSVLYQIVGRYIAHTSIAWTEESARYCMIWLAFLGGGSLVRSGENSSVTFIKDRFPPRIKKIVDIVILCIMLMLIVVIFGLSVTQVPKYSLNEVSPALRISMLIPKSSVLFGTLILGIQLLLKLIDAILAVKEKIGDG